MSTTGNEKKPPEDFREDVLSKSTHTHPDFVTSKGFSRSSVNQPLHFFYSLNDYETFSGAQQFLNSLVNTVLGFIPGVHPLNRTNYIHQSLRLTRYRDFRSDAL